MKYMKSSKIECKLTSDEKADILQRKSLMQFKTVGDYILFCHQTASHISNLAISQGIKPSEVPEFVKWMLDSPTFEEHLALWVEEWENQKQS
jgi:hypothetical protein